jgi:hypothetical protein
MYATLFGGFEICETGGVLVKQYIFTWSIVSHTTCMKYEIHDCKLAGFFFK